MKIGARKLTIIVIASVALIALILISGNIFETNKAGYYQVKQAALSGKMSVKTEPGVYSQMFGMITTYAISDMYYFSTSDLDGGSGAESDPIQVRFNDGGTALISGSVKFALSTKMEDQLRLHQDFRSYNAVRNDLIRQVVAEALKQTASMFKAEDTYSTRRAEFTALIEEQIKQGIYDTVADERVVLDADGNEIIERSLNVRYGDDGNPVIRKISPFINYNVEVRQVVLKDIDFDETIDRLIAQKKEAEQQKVVAKANADKARQDAITAEEQGKARIAQAKADEEVEKIRAVTQAQKESEVAELHAQKELTIAELNRRKAEEEAAALLAQKEAEATANRLLVNAGLTPAQKAEFDMKTAIGVAEALAQWEGPQIVQGSGSGSGNSLLDAAGLNQMLELVQKLNTTN